MTERHGTVFSRQDQAERLLAKITKQAPELAPELGPPEDANSSSARWRVTYLPRPMLAKDRYTPQPHDRHWLRPEYHSYYGPWYSKVNPDFEYCCAAVWGQWSHKQCGKLAKKDPDYTGKPTRCAVHSRASLAQKAAKENARFAAQREASARTARESRAKNAAIGLIKEIARGHNDARGAAQNFLSEYGYSEGKE